MAKKSDHVKPADENLVSKLPMPKEKLSLYLRAPHWITNREKSVGQVKELNQRIVDVRFPRQKSAHFCFVDFASADDRTKALKELQALEVEKQIVVTQVTKDKPKLLAKRIEKVEKKREAKKEVIALLKSAAEQESRDANQDKKLSSKISIKNVPKDITIDDLKNKFPNAVNISLEHGEKRTAPGQALLTYPTPNDALKDSKRSVTLNGKQLKLSIEYNKKPESTKAAIRRTRKKVRYFSKPDEGKSAKGTSRAKAAKGKYIKQYDAIKVYD